MVVPYDPGCSSRFRELAAHFRAALGDVAVRIDHIGSTAVPGLAAKPIVDFQISVRTFEPLEVYRQPLERMGFRYRADNSDRSKRYFREPPGAPRTHVHVREAGSSGERYALVFRDYLRTHPDAARRYAALKERLAEKFREDRGAYTDATQPHIDLIKAKAEDWADAAGWAPSPSDA